MQLTIRILLLICHFVGTSYVINLIGAEISKKVDTLLVLLGIVLCFALMFILVFHIIDFIKFTNKKIKKS